MPTHHDVRRHVRRQRRKIYSLWTNFENRRGVAPPPKRVIVRDLTTVHTRSGIALDDRPDDVLRIYRKAPFAPVPGHTSLRMLNYAHDFVKSCGQVENLYFLEQRLILIELLSGC